MKTCRACLITQDFSNFYKKVSGKDGLNANCKTCMRKVVKTRRQNNPVKAKQSSNNWKAKYPDKYKNSQLRARYGITLDTYNQMLSAQNERCLGCNKHQSELKINMAVDHCHVTGKIRGLLCDACNKALGYMKDNPETADNLAIYLRKSDAL